MCGRNGGMKRGGIYFFFDQDGIVDDYIPYLLNDLIKNKIGRASCRERV